jgi:hypothetical protein
MFGRLRFEELQKQLAVSPFAMREAAGLQPPLVWWHQRHWCGADVYVILEGRPGVVLMYP